MGSRLLSLFLALAGLALRAQTTSPCANTPAYATCELVFELSEQVAAAHPQPYRTVEMKAEFRSPRRRTLAMPAYWDGGRRMVVRFSPTEPGDWDYRVTSNVADFDGKTGNFIGGRTEGPFRSHGQRAPLGLHGAQPAAFVDGASEPRFAFLDDAAFRATADARRAEFTPPARAGDGEGGTPLINPDAPDLAQFQRLDSRVRYLNQKGITADLILAGGAGLLTKTFPSWEQRRRFIRYLVGRYGAMNVTWQGVDRFEDYPDGRALLKEIGGLLKQLDLYQHPRTTGARVTSRRC
jgi:hypothetical protein